MDKTLETKPGPIDDYIYSTSKLDLSPVRAPIGQYSALWRDNDKAILSFRLDNLKEVIPYFYLKHEDGHMYLQMINGSEKEITPEDLSRNLIDLCDKQNKKLNEKSKEFINKEAELVYSQLQEYACLYDLYNNPHFQNSPLKVHSLKDKNNLIEVGTILAIPKNEFGSLIVEMTMNKQDIVLSKKSGTDTWNQIEVDEHSEDLVKILSNGAKGARLLMGKKDDVEKSVNSYVDDMTKLMPLAKKIKKVLSQIHNQRLEVRNQNYFGKNENNLNTTLTK